MGKGARWLSQGGFDWLEPFLEGKFNFEIFIFGKHSLKRLSSTNAIRLALSEAESLIF